MGKVAKAALRIRCDGGAERLSVGEIMPIKSHTNSRLAILFPVLALAGLAITGCGGGSTSSSPLVDITSVSPVSPDSGSATPEPPVSPPVTSEEPLPPPDEPPTVSGQVVYRDTGEPYAGAIVEFKNLYGENVHTTTDADGHYSMQLPADTYTALALDLNDNNAGFEVTGRPDNAVTVPPSATVNFEAYPIT
jgi:hypothetical protein